MADLVMGAMPSIIPKLYQLLEKEYNLQTSVKECISSLTQELELAQAALRKVAQVPWDQLDEQVQIWARQVRVASYDMEDVLDTFLVRVKGHDSAEQEESLLKHLKKMTNFFKKSKARRKISGDVMDIMTHLQEVTERCRRYKVDDIVVRRATASTIDPCLAAMYTQVKNLVGMDKSSSDLISMLHNPKQGDVSSMKTKIVSIVGVGGLGKTTLAKAVCDKIKEDFGCKAFVSVGRNPDLQKVLQMVLIRLDKRRYERFNFAVFQDITQFIDELREFLHDNKRYLIVIDDIWEVESWETIKFAMDDDNDSGARIIMTTRKLEVATKADEIYKLQPLPYDSSRELFLTRISGHQGKYIPNKISDKYIRKCGGIPLAIITMASLLARKPRDEWSELYNTIDFKEAKNTMRILSFSYYDLPSHLRTCLLYLSAFPEDSVVLKDSLVWMWVAEGFVHEKEGMSLFEIGEGYFNDLINRSMIQPESGYDDSIIYGCRVHDMVLDFIRSMSQAESFFTVLDNDQGTPLQQSNIVRRLANHNRTKGHIHRANHIEMSKLRSFIALGCVSRTWTLLSSFTLLRVLSIENCRAPDYSCVRVDHLGGLLHLRFLSLRGTSISRIPEGIGALRFLQTLDLWQSFILKLPSSGSLPKQLACLRITFLGDDFDGMVFPVEGMTSLEELTIYVPSESTGEWPENGLSSLRELRVLNISHIFCRTLGNDLLESLGHLDKLQTLTIGHDDTLIGVPTWEPTVALPRHLQHLAANNIIFSRLPSCINPSCLSHLDLRLEHLDEEDLKTLGGLPELHYLCLDFEVLLSTATIHNISDTDAGYFPKLRCFKLVNSMFSFIPHNDQKRVSFHIWNAVDISVPYVSDDELHSPRPSVSDDELKSDDEMQSPMPSVSDDELNRDDEIQSPMPSVSHDDELHRPLKSSKLQQGLAAVAYYLVAFFLHVLAYVKRWPLNKLMGQHPMPSSNRASSPGNVNVEDPAATPSVSEDETKGSTICSKGTAAAAPRFMPSLQVLHLRVYYPLDIPNWVNSLGWEHLSSLREINADIEFLDGLNNKLETMLRCAAEVHPNHPTLHMEN